MWVAVLCETVVPGISDVLSRNHCLEKSCFRGEGELHSWDLQGEPQLAASCSRLSSAACHSDKIPSVSCWWHPASGTGWSNWVVIRLNFGPNTAWETHCWTISLRQLAAAHGWGECLLSSQGRGRRRLSQSLPAWETPAPASQLPPADKSLSISRDGNFPITCEMQEPSISACGKKNVPLSSFLLYFNRCKK